MVAQLHRADRRRFIRWYASCEETVAIMALANRLNAPLTSSVGRLFDAVAALLGLRLTTRFEGQAAMELEFAIGSEKTEEAYPFTISNQPDSELAGTQAAMIVDWEPMIRTILQEVGDQIPLARISRKFHNTLVEMIVEVARRIAEERVVLTGGCFQNKFLTEHSVRRLEAEGFRPYWHQRIPPNDGGIALGQIVAASRLGKAVVSD